MDQPKWRYCQDANGYSIELSFSPLRTINGSHYTCKASVNITTTEMVNEMASTDLRVVSKCEKIQRMYVYQWSQSVSHVINHKFGH